MRFPPDRVGRGSESVKALYTRKGGTCRDSAEQIREDRASPGCPRHLNQRSSRRGPQRHRLYIKDPDGHESPTMPMTGCFKIPSSYQTPKANPSDEGSASRHGNTFSNPVSAKRPTGALETTEAQFPLPPLPAGPSFRRPHRGADPPSPGSAPRRRETSPLSGPAQ